MARLLPTPQDAYPHTTLTTSMSGASYRITWLWNTRDGHWTFSLTDTSGVALVSGVRVVLNVDLLAHVPAGDTKPPYPLLVLDPTGKGQEPTRDNLGGTVKVVYMEPSE